MRRAFAEAPLQLDLELQVVEWPAGAWLPDGWGWERGGQGGMRRARRGLALAVHVSGAAAWLRLGSPAADVDRAAAELATVAGE